MPSPSRADGIARYGASLRPVRVDSDLLQRGDQDRRVLAFVGSEDGEFATLNRFDQSDGWGPLRVAERHCQAPDHGEVLSILHDDVPEEAERQLTRESPSVAPRVRARGRGMRRVRALLAAGVAIRSLQRLAVLGSEALALSARLDHRVADREALVRQRSTSPRQPEDFAQESRCDVAAEQSGVALGEADRCPDILVKALAHESANLQVVAELLNQTAFTASSGELHQWWRARNSNRRKHERSIQEQNSLKLDLSCLRLSSTMRRIAHTIGPVEMCCFDEAVPNVAP